MKNKIALAMIIKGTGNEPTLLDQALKSAAEHVDGIFLTITGKKSETKEAQKVAKKYGAILSYTSALHTYTQEETAWLESFFDYEPYSKTGDKIFLFNEARTYNFLQVPAEYDWILWLDCDDILAGGEELKTLAQEGDRENIEAWYLEYWYNVEWNKDKTKIKNIIIKHLRERLVRNVPGLFKWIAPIHETLIEQRPSRKKDDERVKVVHTAEEFDRQSSLVRNMRNLEYAIYTTEGKDPRHLYYLAKAYFDINTPETDEKAIILIDMYLTGDNPSGWPEERAQAREYLSEIYKRSERFDEAIEACLLALKEQPEIPSIYLSLAQAYARKEDYERALFWVMIASKIPEKKTTLVVNPKDVQGRTLEIIYNCSIQMGKIDEAWGAAVKLTDLYPDDEQTLQCLRFADGLRRERDFTADLQKHISILQATGEMPKIKTLLASVPAPYIDNPVISNLYKQHNPPKKWEEDEITIYCGAGFTPWGPNYMREPKDTFVGGSEEAVIKAAEELTKQGWRVTVYNDPGEDEGEHNGVTYAPYHTFNRLDNFNILIGWRDIRFFDSEFSTQKTYLWAHDIQNAIEYTPERLARITKVMFLSDWHRKNVEKLEDEKIFLTSNGI